jgi:predicted permease
VLPVDAMSSHSVIFSTFLASIHSVGKVCTLTLAGVYLQRRGFILSEGKRTLALISQQLLTPCFLFTKIVNCRQNGSNERCPSITDSLHDVWVLIVWPIYVVGWGLLVGYLVAHVTSSPPEHRPVVLAACAFPNFLGVPIVLLDVISADFPSSGKMGATEPTVFLSIFLILFPMIQWGLGGFLLSPEEHHFSGAESHKYGTFDDNTKIADHSIKNYITRNVLNNTCVPGLYTYAHKGIQDTDACLYVSNSNLAGLDAQVIIVDEDHGQKKVVKASFPSRMPRKLSLSTIAEAEEETLLSQMVPLEAEGDVVHQHHISLVTSRSIAPKSYHMDQYATAINTLGKIVSRCLQPPVIGALMGLLVVSIPPLRGVLVDTVTRKSNAPLQFVFDGLLTLGQAAIPINMVILGASLLPKGKKIPESANVVHAGDLARKSLVGIVVGKMVIMPIIGVLSCSILRMFTPSIPEGL